MNDDEKRIEEKRPDGPGRAENARREGEEGDVGLMEPTEPEHEPFQGVMICLQLRRWAERTGHEGVVWHAERSLVNILDVADINSGNSEWSRWLVKRHRIQLHAYGHDASPDESIPSYLTLRGVV